VATLSCSYKPLFVLETKGYLVSLLKSRIETQSLFPLCFCPSCPASTTPRQIPFYPAPVFLFVSVKQKAMRSLLSFRPSRPPPLLSSNVSLFLLLLIVLISPIFPTRIHPKRNGVSFPNLRGFKLGTVVRLQLVRFKYPPIFGNSLEHEGYLLKPLDFLLTISGRFFFFFFFFSFFVFFLCRLKPSDLPSAASLRMSDVPSSRSSSPPSSFYDANSHLFS